ncbi:uncharacterized protein SCHCODRAFT_02316256 [Schizophyllum commune H4-8]|uniref:uncharacterized protein n=1 Tax=Schizophyllum commune (strain H4-8 / FGSC 9210) TaxID=578458 RepID=UPI002160C802|nr:uncharacterized protein SCHCODRAFT_02316256 [Schizophyllum commune H4-8]KAI5891322.1 hypothetical protein SCHCODRAFT_02316256 [Schizophyllum commune H4-8]
MALDVLGSPASLRGVGASSSPSSSSESSDSSSSARAAEAEVDAREAEARKGVRLFVDALRLVVVVAAGLAAACFAFDLVDGASVAFALRLVDAAVGLAYAAVRFLISLDCDGPCLMDCDGPANSGVGDLDAEGKVPLVVVWGEGEGHRMGIGCAKARSACDVEERVREMRGNATDQDDAPGCREICPTTQRTKDAFPQRRCNDHRSTRWTAHPRTMYA